MGGEKIAFRIPRWRPFRKVVQLKIVLEDTNPPVWRRIQIPESYTFYDLHAAIQSAMGWTDSHLHMFEIPTDKGEEHPIVIDGPFGETEEPLLSNEVAIEKYLSLRGDRAAYIYDFGDYWIHDLTVEDIQTKIARRRYPVCLDGALACPPEDCGGFSGYYDCIRALQKRRPKDLLIWLGSWRPDAFDPKKVAFENPRKRFLENLED